MSPEEAYRICEEATRKNARNFYYGIRLLEPPRRKALSTIYAMARRIDDIGDGELVPEEKLRRLEEARASLRGGGDGEDPVLSALAHASSLYPIPMDAFEDLLDGCEMDVRGQSYGTFEDLVVYCRRVAGSIGRLSLGVFGSENMEQAAPLADSLGVALQLTNILRDVLEDKTMGRVYLPKEDLDRFGVGADLEGSADALVGVVLLIASRARNFYSEGYRLFPLLDRRSRACAGAMAGIYRRLLGRIETRPESVLTERVSLSSLEKAWVAFGAIGGLRP